MDSSVVTNPITLNNEKFTHLLVLREILLTKSSTQIDIFCHDLLEAFDFNHKLLANILFHGMHKMLYNININMINKCMNKLSSAKSEPEMKTHNANISVIDTKHKKRKMKIFGFNDIPCDVISYCLLQYFDSSTLLSFEKVSKLYLSRARSAVLPAFNFNLSQFLSYTNVSCDLLRFQNTKTLSILFDDDSKNPYFRRRLNNASENNRRNYRRNLRCIHKSQILCQQLSYFANKDRYMPPGVWRKCDKSRNEITQLEWNKLDLILSQFKQYNNLERLTLCCKSEERNESSIINNFMKYLPNLEMLCNLKVLELECVNFKRVNVGMSIGLCELRLTNLVIESNFLQIMNDFMVNLETIYLSNVSIEFEHGLNINIDKLLIKTVQQSIAKQDLSVIPSENLLYLNMDSHIAAMHNVITGVIDAAFLRLVNEYTMNNVLCLDVQIMHDMVNDNVCITQICDIIKYFASINVRELNMENFAVKQIYDVIKQVLCPHLRRCVITKCPFGGFKPDYILHAIALKFVEEFKCDIDDGLLRKWIVNDANEWSMFVKAIQDNYKLKSIEFCIGNISNDCVDKLCTLFCVIQKHALNLNSLILTFDKKIYVKDVKMLHSFIIECILSKRNQLEILSLT
eukprot:96563_1